MEDEIWRVDRTTEAAYVVTECPQRGAGQQVERRLGDKVRRINRTIEAGCIGTGFSSSGD